LTSVVSIRVSDEERERWEASASGNDIAFTVWAKRALNEQADLDAVLMRQHNNPQLEEGLLNE